MRCRQSPLECCGRAREPWASHRGGTDTYCVGPKERGAVYREEVHVAEGVALEDALACTISARSASGMGSLGAAESQEAGKASPNISRLRV